MKSERLPSGESLLYKRLIYNNKINIDHLLILFIIFIPFFRFSNLSNFKFFFGFTVISIILLNRPILKYFNRKIDLVGFKVFFYWIIISLFFSIDKTNTFIWVVDFFFIYLFFVLLSGMIRSTSDLMIIDRIFVFYLLVELIFAVGQFLNIPFLYYYTEEQRGLNAILADEGSRLWGTFMNSITLSSFTSSIGIYLFVKYFQRGYKTKSYIILSISCILILLSGSRTGIVSLFIPLMIFVFQAKGAYKSFSLIILFIVVILYNTNLFDNLQNTTLFKRSIEAKDGRLWIWYYTIPLILDHPLIGTTFGNIGSYVTNYNLLKNVLILSTSKSSHLENVYLTILASTGILGLIIFLFQWIALFTKCIKILRRSSSIYISSTINGCLFSLISISISMFFEPSYLTTQNSLLLLFVFISIIYSSFINNIFLEN